MLFLLFTLFFTLFGFDLTLDFARASAAISVSDLEVLRVAVFFVAGFFVAGFFATGFLAAFAGFLIFYLRSTFSAVSLAIVSSFALICESSLRISI